MSRSIDHIKKEIMIMSPIERVIGLTSILINMSPSQWAIGLTFADVVPLLPTRRATGRLVL